MHNAATALSFRNSSLVIAASLSSKDDRFSLLQSDDPHASQRSLTAIQRPAMKNSRGVSQLQLRRLATRVWSRNTDCAEIHTLVADTHRPGIRRHLNCLVQGCLSMLNRVHEKTQLACTRSWHTRADPI